MSRQKLLGQRTHFRNPLAVEKELTTASNALLAAAKKYGNAEVAGSQSSLKKARRGLLLAAYKTGIAKRKLAAMAKLDAKFGIENDAAFNERAFKFLRAPKKTNFSFAILDLDSLKIINDKYGHAAGDRALGMFTSGAAQVAKKFKGFAGRFGGDEIKMVADCKPEELMHELYSLLEKMNLENYRFSAGIASGESVSAIKDPSGKKQRELLEKQADHALYVMKESRKGRIGIYRKPPNQLQLFK